MYQFCGVFMKAKVHIPFQSAISNYVTAIWETTPPGVSSELILPKGVVELVFNLSDPMQGILPHQQTPDFAPNCFLQGMNTHVVKVEYTGTQHLFGICLRPHMVKALLGIPASECRDCLIDLGLLNKSFDDVWHQLKEANSFTERVAIIEKTFPVLHETDCSRTVYFSGLFTEGSNHRIASIDELSKEICYSSRQLNRKAQHLFGLSTEELLLHKKFRTAVTLLHGNKKSLTSIAYEAGFYDQAHFCRIFKNFTGLTAKQYQQHKSELPFHLFS